MGSIGDSRSPGSQSTGYVARRDVTGHFIPIEDPITTTSSSVQYVNIQMASPVSLEDTARLEGVYLANTMVTGGFATKTRAHGMPRKVEQRPIRALDICYLPGCNNKAMPKDVCECQLKICAACFTEAIGPSGGKICPGCKMPYGNTNIEEFLERSESKSQSGRREEPIRRPPMMSFASMDFDAESWYSSAGAFRRNGNGMGNASVWPEENGVRRIPRAVSVDMNDTMSQFGGLEGRVPGGNRWRPMTRKITVGGALSAYRMIAIIRIIALALFLMWRVINVNNDAVWLWAMSVICEIWFAFCWLLDQLPKLSPLNRVANPSILKEKYEIRSLENPNGRSKLPGIDVLINTADPGKEPPLVTANTVLSVLAANYPVDKLACYLSDDAGSLLTYETMADTVNFAALWVPFCRKHDIEPRNPESYFNLKRDPYKGKVHKDFVVDRRRVKREYDEFKVRINGLYDVIKKRSSKLNTHNQMILQQQFESGENLEAVKVAKKLKATWMADETPWTGTWINPTKEHARNDHAGIIQVMIRPPMSDEPQHGNTEEICGVHIDFTGIDIRLPMLVYLSREMRPGYDHNKKAGAMNALLRSSAVMSNGPFILDLDCDHYVNNSLALREAMCFMMERGGAHVAFVQFPQRFEGVDSSDRYNINNRVFYDITMRGLDGIQGPEYVGTGCMFRRTALYGLEAPKYQKKRSCFDACFPQRRALTSEVREAEEPLQQHERIENPVWRSKFGNSNYFLDSIKDAEMNGRPLAEQTLIDDGSDSLPISYEPLTTTKVAEAIGVISCWYENNTDWGYGAGWVYGSILHDIITGYKMHNRGWCSIYYNTKPDSFRGTAPINLTDKLHQMLYRGIGAVELFFSSRNALFASSRLKFLQRAAYFNINIYPFTSIFLVIYCLVPALSLFTNQFIIKTVSLPFLVYLLVFAISLSALALLEVKWGEITIGEWWRSMQFWIIGGTSANLFAVFQGLIKVFTGIEIKTFTWTAESFKDDDQDEFAEFHVIKWSPLFIPPLMIMFINIVAIAVGVSRAIYGTNQNWGKLIGGVLFSLWVIAHYYPFSKGLMGKQGRAPAILLIWAGLLSITIALLCIAIDPPPNFRTQIGGSFSLT
ncbi:hypothetical protein LUZ60_011655 [Juncus effusus]|nr:hypothetical protein LUZ60_011655 [Juncus effusus]